MELQHTTPKRSRRSSKQPVRPTIGWTPLELARFGSIALVAAGPWYYASAPWLSQYWMVWAALSLAVLMAGELARRIWLKQDTSRVMFPSLSVVFLCLAAYGWGQSIPFFSVDSSGGRAPASVELQRWFLGTSNPDLDAKFQTTANVPASTTDIPESEAWAAEAKLALSVEPLHTRAAVGGLAVVALMIWIGATAFQTRYSQLALMIFMSIMGVIFGLIGIAHVLSWERVNWLGLDSSQSFATFVSRNTAGGFLNLCLAGSIGLAAWAFKQPRDKEHRYSYGAESPGLRILHSIEDIVAQLTTMQISSLLATSFILIGVFCTGSRGAAISAIVASSVALLLSQNKKNKVGVWAFALFVVAIGLTGLYVFELDERITTRFSELTSASTLEKDSHVGRLYIWSVALKAFSYYGIFGSGLGTFHFAHLPFQDPTVGSGWYYHAESLYAQALVELGWPGAIAIVAIFVMCFRSIQKLGASQPVIVTSNSKSKNGADQHHAIFLVGLTLAIGQAVHSIFDFALIVPAVFVPAGLLFGMVYGAARNKSRLESSAVESAPGNESQSVRSHRLPKVEGSRFSNLREPEPQVVPTANRSWTKETSWMLVGSLGLLLFLGSSLRPIDAMSRVDEMNRWLQDQSKVNRASRIGSPSAFLAGLWGKPSISIFQVPDALRILGESVLYEFRSQKMDQAQSESKEKKSVNWETTSPLILRLAAFEEESEARSKGANRDAFNKSAELETLMGGSKQTARWNKARELIERAHLQSPLDWRLVWGRLLLDRDLNIAEWNGWFDRSMLVSRHRPDTLFQIGVLAWQAAKDREHVYPLWTTALKLSPALAPSAATIIAMTTPDSEVPVEILPPSPQYLGDCVRSPFTETQFPITNDKIWKKIGESALELSLNDPNRYNWLAATAAHFGDTEKELEYLGEMVNRNSMNKQLRMQFADRLATVGRFEAAIEHAEICRSMAPDDPQIEASLKRLKSLESDAKKRE